MYGVNSISAGRLVPNFSMETAATYGGVRFFDGKRESNPSFGSRWSPRRVAWSVAAVR